MVKPWLFRPLKKLFEFRFLNWDVTGGEVDRLSGVYSRLFAKYFPDFYHNSVAVKIEPLNEA